MSTENSNSHLTLDERRIILSGITNGSTKVAIAQTIGKDKSTVGKEIKLHRILSHKSSLPLECINYKKCKFGRICSLECQDYFPFKCKRRDRSPGACNGCSNWSKCRFNKYTYNAEKAQATYEETLVDSRLGVNLTVSEAQAISDVIREPLKNGQSPYAVLKAHPELDICEKTLYNYIEGNVFKDITVMDLRRQVSRKISKKKSATYKKRKDNKYLEGRKFKDYLSYVKDNPDVFITQMDTVYNDGTNGPFIQTFKFLSAGILFALFHTEKTAAAMLSGVNILEDILGTEVFRKYVHVLLTDRGSEFSAAEEMENSSDGSRRTRVFFCDPMQSGQKGSLENNHEELRYIFPKSINLYDLGLTSQGPLTLALSHINSYPVEKLGGKSPLELTEFLYPDLFKRFTTFGIKKIAKDDIILRPYLLKKH